MNCHQCRQECGPKQQRPWWSWLGSEPDAQSHSSLQFPADRPIVALVGTPNVGKSALFGALTGTYVTVSNYPGTTVEVTQGQAHIGDRPTTIIDTPGMYSLLPITEEERVARDLLLDTPLNLVVHVVDAKNLGRMLSLTVQLLEMGLPLLLVLNMIDEAQQLNLHIHRESLETELGIPVVMTTATQNQGISVLKTKIAPYVQLNSLSPSLSPAH